MQHLKKSKTTSLFKIISITILVLGILNTVVNYNIIPKSKYKKNTTIVTGTITNCSKNNYNHQITIKDKEKILINYEGKFNCKLGIKIKVQGKLIKPNSNTIFNLFNYQKYLLSQKINYTFKANKIEILNNNPALLYKIKNDLQNKINQYKSKEYLNAFILGNTKTISDDIMDSYQNNGISHLLAISGMHITFISAIILFILNKVSKNNKIYLITGGMPESVYNMVNTNGDYIKYDSTILKDIVRSYFEDMSKYVTSEIETLKITRVYNSLPSQLSNLSNKFQYSRIDKDARARDYITSIDWLEASNMVLRAKCTKLPSIPLEGFIDVDTFKLYLSDVGILNNILKITLEDILTDTLSLYKGIIAENYVANQLICLNYDLYYWKNDNQSEIDFLIHNKDGIIPVEVKAGDNTQSKSLKLFMEKYDCPYGIRISTKELGFDSKSKIKSIPLYAVFVLKK